MTVTRQDMYDTIRQDAADIGWTEVEFVEGESGHFDVLVGADGATDQTFNGTLVQLRSRLKELGGPELYPPIEYAGPHDEVPDHPGFDYVDHLMCTLTHGQTAAELVEYAAGASAPLGIPGAIEDLHPPEVYAEMAGAYPQVPGAHLLEGPKDRAAHYADEIPPEEWAQEFVFTDPEGQHRVRPMVGRPRDATEDLKADLQRVFGSGWRSIFKNVRVRVLRPRQA